MPRGLGRYVTKRVLLLVPLLFGISVLTFLLVRLGDTSPAALIAGPTATAEQIAAIETELGLDLPLPVQYGRYLSDAATGDFGTSWQSNRPVLDEISERLPVTLELITLGMVGAILFGVTAGLISAVKKKKAPDQLVRVLTLFGLSIPIFWLALLLILVFYSQVSWAPAPLGRIDRFVEAPPYVTGWLTIDSLLSGQWASFRSAAAHLALPVLTITVISGATIAKQARATLVEALASPAIRYARACGLPPRQVRSMALRNAMPDVVGYIGITFSLSLGGSALIELVFSWGGLGQLGLDAITSADFAVVQGYVLCMGVITAAVYLLADLVVAFIDPRVSLR